MFGALKKIFQVRSEVFTEVTVKITVLWNEASCSLVNDTDIKRKLLV